MVEIIRVRMPDGVAAKTDGVNIFLDDRLNDIQEKCAIEHELIHIERGHSIQQVEAVELSVRYEAAVRLIPDPSVPCVGSNLAARARNLGVTRQVLMDRAATMNDAEAVAGGCVECLMCPSMEARYGRRSVVPLRTPTVRTEQPAQSTPDSFTPTTTSWDESWESAWGAMYVPA